MNLSELLPVVAMQVPDAKPAEIEEAAQQAVVAFMTDSQVFTDYAELTPQPCVNEYIIDLPADRVLVSIHAVLVNGEAVSNWYRDEHNDILAFPDGTPKCKSIFIRYAWKVKRGACEFPDKLYEDYLPAVLAKAVSILHSMFGTTVVSASRAYASEIQYENIVNNVLARRMINFSRTRARMHRGRQRSRRCLL